MGMDGGPVLSRVCSDVCKGHEISFKPTALECAGLLFLRLVFNCHWYLKQGTDGTDYKEKW